MVAVVVVGRELRHDCWCFNLQTWGADWRAGGHTVAPPPSPYPPITTITPHPPAHPCFTQADGSVVIPEVLRPFMMGISTIKPRKVVQQPSA